MKIAIIGASYLQVPLIVKAKEMGYETHCFAWEEGAVGKGICDFFYPISILDREAVFDKCYEIGVDGVTTIATDMAVPTICYVAEKLNLVSNSFESSLMATDKSIMRSRFKKFNILSPLYLQVDLTDDSFLSNNFFQNTKFPYIVKPVDRSGSRGVNKVDNLDQLVASVKFACGESFKKKCLIEEYIDGKEVSIETISWKGSHYLLAITDKVTTGPPFFVELAHHQPADLNPKTINLLESETFKALDALDIKYGAGHSEFKITKEGKIYIIEVGARMGGDFIGSHLVKLSTGYDFLEGVLKIAINQFIAPVLNNSVCAGVYFLSKETEFLLPYFYESNNFEIEKEVLSLELKTIKNSNDRSGYLIYKSDEKVLLD